MQESTSNNQSKRIRAVYGNYLICIYLIADQFEYNIWIIHNENIDHIEHRRSFSTSDDAFAYGIIRMHMLNSQDELGFDHSVIFLD